MEGPQMPRGAVSRIMFVAVCLVVALFAGSPANAVPSNCNEGDFRATIDSGATSITLPANCIIVLTGAADDDANVSGDIDISANTTATTVTIIGAGVGSTIIDGGG